MGSTDTAAEPGQPLNVLVRVAVRIFDLGEAALEEGLRVPTVPVLLSVLEPRMSETYQRVEASQVPPVDDWSRTVSVVVAEERLYQVIGPVQ